MLLPVTPSLIWWYFRRVVCCAVLIGTWAGAEHCLAADTPWQRAPDVLFLTVDDLNDWNDLFLSDDVVHLPNLRRLAARGTFFTHAYCASPACNPSRIATLTGLRPTTTGVYGNKSDWRRALPDRPTIMQQYMAAGYEVKGAGKIFHHQFDGAFHDDRSFHDFQPMPVQQYPPEKLNQAPDYGSRNTDWGAWPARVEDTIDFQTASYCVRVLEQPVGPRPLMLACGIYKPHSPFFAPPPFHQAVQELAMPVRREDDWNDLPPGAVQLLGPKKWFWDGMMRLEQRRPGSYRDFVRAYAACATLADAQIGRVLDALDRSPRRDNTIILLWSDHGFHLGEKDHIEKFALWEKTTHIPFLIVAPGVTKPGSVCHAPVDMSAVYPTLMELCQLPGDVPCDGQSLLSLLRDPQCAWDRPAVMTYLPGNHAVRSRRWRYICYADGTQELYDHRTDGNEWKNLAGDARYAAVMAEHRRWLPTSSAKQVADLRPPR